MLQVRVSIPEFSNGINFTDPIILENAGSIELSKTVNSSDEGISFTLPLTDSKMPYVTSSGFYLRWWECWDTDTNTRLNYGPLTDMARTGGDAKKFSGPGRSAVFLDYYKTIQTFYYPIDVFIDDLRYENLSAEPRTTTIINKNTDSDYYGLSMRSKDYAIDEQTGYISIGRDTPDKGTLKTDVYWSGVGRSDWLTVDLGDTYTVSKVRVLLPWWGGVTINNNRAYDWSIQHSTDNSAFTSLYTTPVPNYHIMNPSAMGTTVYAGESGYEFDQIPASGISAISAQYWKLNIANTHAWYGSIYFGEASDEWGWECGQSDVYKGETRESPTISGGIIPTDSLSPANDCYASAVELGFYKRIIARDTISNLSYKQIENDNRQITYWHSPEASEMISAGSGKKFEPGTFFRKVTIVNAGTVKDEYNAVLHEGTGQVALNLPAYTRLLRCSNASAQVVNCDTWKGVLDAFSYGGSYQYTEIAGDYLVLNFRGVSIKWIATVPDGKTAGHVSIELRSKDDSTGVWSAWQTLETDYTLPTNIAGEKVWEITYESNTLQDDTTYELRITNLNGGYVSIDAFAGFWSASFVEISEADSRWGFRNPNEALPFYDERYSLGSALQYRAGATGTSTKQGISFTGDRVIVYSRKDSPGYGSITIGIITSPPDGPSDIVVIPGGDGDGRLTIDLSSPYNITQAVVFDSNDYFTGPGLPWGSYRLMIYKLETDGKIWVDGVGLHETQGLSVKFINTPYLDIIKNTAEALQMEWDVTEAGLKVVPRIGTDTNIIFAEGRGTTISVEDNEEAREMATQLISNGADINGIPLSTVVEDKKTRSRLGRTIQRLYDLRNVGDYFTLIGAARAELMRRAWPKKRVIITRVGTLGINPGDSFLVKTPEINERMRAVKITRSQSVSSGTEYRVECEPWPPVI